MQETWPRNLWQGAAGYQQGDWAEGELLSFQKLTISLSLFKGSLFTFQQSVKIKTGKTKDGGKKAFLFLHNQLTFAKVTKLTNL